MEKTKLLTISIAAYNVAPYLEQTLQSLVVDKDPQRLEVLIINDGSKDDTASIAQRYADRFPQTFILINKENGGHGSTINAGIENATGKYFKVLDGDDWVDTKGLEELLDRLEDTDVDLVLTDRINVYETKKEKIKFEDKIPPDRTQFFASLAIPLSITLPSISVKTKRIRGSGYRCLEHCYYEDLEFDSYSIAVSDTFIYYPIDLYQYRLGREGQSITPVNLQKNLNMSYRVAQTIDLFYSAAREQLSQGQRLCIVERATLIHAQIIATCMTLTSDEENRKRFRDFILNIQSDDIRTGIRKNKAYMRILCDFPWTYRLVVRLHKFAKHRK